MTSPPPATDRTILEARLKRARRALEILEGQAGGYTSLTTPVHLQIELEEKRAEVAGIEAQLTGGAPGAGGAVAPAASRTRLRENLERVFSLQELATLCFDLGVDFDALPGSGKEAKARELVIDLEHRGRIPDLIALCQQRRPKVAWE